MVLVFDKQRFLTNALLGGCRLHPCLASPMAKSNSSRGRQASIAIPGPILRLCDLGMPVKSYCPLL